MECVKWMLGLLFLLLWRIICNSKVELILFLDLIFINTIIPLQFTYQKTTNSIDEERLFEKMKGLKPEKNSIILKFSELKIEAKNAFESQALLELKNSYCASKRCLECAIGNKLLRS